MSKEEADFLEKLRHLSISAAYELVSGVDRLKQLHEERTSGDVDEDAAKRRSKMRDLAFRFAKAELEHAESILNLSHTQADLLFEHARSVVRRSRSKGEPTKVAEFHEHDGKVQARFSIRNPFDAEVFARFDLEKFKNQSGAEEPLLEKVKVTSDPMCIPPRGNAEIVATVDKDILSKLPADGKLAPGVYFADVRVFVSAEVETRVAHRLLRLRTDVCS